MYVCIPYSGFLPRIEKTATQNLAIQGERENKVTRPFILIVKIGDSLSVMNEECCVACSRRILHATEIRPPCRLK